MKRTSKWLINFVSFSLLFVSLNGIAAVNYPENPAIDDAAIYLSDAGISKINIETLETEWNVLTHKKTFEPVVTSRHVVVGSSTGMYVLDKLSGSIIRNIQTENTLFSPVVENNIAFVGSETGLFQAIDLQTGEILWSRKFEGWVYPPAVVGETLVVGGNRPYISALDKTNGKTLWEKRISQELVYRPVGIDHSRVVISTFGNETQLINSKNGNVIWTIRDKVPNLSPVLINNEIVFGTLDGRLQSVNLSNGKLHWEYRMGGHLSIQAYPKQATVMISNNQGMIVKVDANDGHVKWQKRISNELVGAPVLLKDDVIVFRSKRFNPSTSVDIFNSSNQAGGYDES
jgi:outer membrane protein assembly factor BamB